LAETAATFGHEGDVKTTLTTRYALAALITAALPVSALAQSYPKTLTGSAETSGAAGRSTAVLTIRIERLMDDLYFKRLTDALQAGGYQKFFVALRTLPPIGYVQLGDTKTDLKYARERTDTPRLVLGTDHPIFFVGAGAPDAKPRAGYEMGVIELDLDAQGSGQGTIAPAARVRRAPDGGVTVDDYGGAPIKLSVKAAK
jgi:hypothetical protein